MKIPNQNLNHNGQSFIEVILAIAILVFAIVGALSLANMSVKIGTQSEEYNIAADLAQEGVEAVRNIRDTNWIEGAAWDAGLNKDSLGGAIPQALQLNNSGEWVLVKGGADNTLGSFSPKYDRVVLVEDTGDAGGKYRITVTVNWGNNDKVEVVDYLTNWKIP